MPARSQDSCRFRRYGAAGAIPPQGPFHFPKCLLRSRQHSVILYLGRLIFPILDKGLDSHAALCRNQTDTQTDGQCKAALFDCGQNTLIDAP